MLFNFVLLGGMYVKLFELQSVERMCAEERLCVVCWLKVRPEHLLAVRQSSFSLVAMERVNVNSDAAEGSAYVITGLFEHFIYSNIQLMHTHTQSDDSKNVAAH